ncbi:MAG TPA: MarR family transcriptional regulator, partial [Rhodospirillaceae bacterium]|nr:MarR family transcriptional regulator [Rhodospirillaceae bacterium]
NDAEFFDALTPEERETLMRLLKSLTQRSQITAIPIE